MARRLSVLEYFDGEETLRPMELVHGIVHEPPAPRYGHQSVVTRTTAVLDQHVRERELGIVCVSPIDVVLDQDDALVLQPDVIFVSRMRAGIVRDRVWGTPDLVVEVLSRGTARRDRTVKLDWYRRYGVRECWLLDPVARTVEIVDCQSPADRHAPICRSVDVIRSYVLPELTLPAGTFFE